jgi:ElaB/YqjD/DUF883 family membrane-anchored ribosome-binding protein
MEKEGERMMSDATAKVGDAVGDLAGKTEKMVEDKIDQGKPVLRDLQASAGSAIDKAAGLARDASSAGIQAVTQASDSIQGVASEVGNKVNQAATTAYRQGARAGGYVSQYAAEQPLTALLIAGAIGYGLAYLIHRN